MKDHLAVLEVATEKTSDLTSSPLKAAMALREKGMSSEDPKPQEEVGAVSPEEAEKLLELPLEGLKI
jgi:hypothetical protein